MEQAEIAPGTVRINPESEPVYQLGDLLLDYLKQLGVKYIFGIPGGAIEPLYNAIARDEKRGGIQSIVSRHESGAGFMADGYFINSGIIGVCCGTTGPGTTNFITSCASLYANQIPAIFITAQTALDTFGRGGFQESSNSESGIDTVKLFEPITNFSTMVTHPQQFEQLLGIALRKALTSPRGPVHLSIPVDVFKEQSPVKKPTFNLSLLCNPSTLIDLEAVDKLCNNLTSGYKIVFMVGDGCGQAINEIIEVATYLNISIVTTPHGKGLISPYHPLYRGTMGFAGHFTAHQVTHDPSVRYLVAIGTRFGEWESNGWDKTILSDKLIHISSDSGFFNRTMMAKLHVLGNISSIFDAILDYLSETSFTEINSIQTVIENKNVKLPGRPTRYFTLDDNDAYNDDSTPIKPQRLMKLLPRFFPYNTHFLADTGNSMTWAIHYLNPRPIKRGRLMEKRLIDNNVWPGQFRTCLEFGSMGWAIGAAIGTAFAKPDDPVICITGDGSYLMSGQEITVAQQNNLTVIYLILNDSSLGMVEHGQRLVGAERTSTQLPKISFAKMARSMGIEAYTIRSPQDLMELDIKEIINRKSPTLLDVLIDKNEIPPMSLRTNTLKSIS